MTQSSPVLLSGPVAHWDVQQLVLRELFSQKWDEQALGAVHILYQPKMGGSWPHPPPPPPYRNAPGNLARIYYTPLSHLQSALKAQTPTITEQNFNKIVIFLGGYDKSFYWSNY